MPMNNNYTKLASISNFKESSFIKSFASDKKTIVRTSKRENIKICYNYIYKFMKLSFHSVIYKFTYKKIAVLYSLIYFYFINVDYCYGSLNAKKRKIENEDLYSQNTSIYAQHDDKPNFNDFQVFSYDFWYFYSEFVNEKFDNPYKGVGSDSMEYLHFYIGMLKTYTNPQKNKNIKNEQVTQDIKYYIEQLLKIDPLKDELYINTKLKDKILSIKNNFEKRNLKKEITIFQNIKSGSIKFKKFYITYLYNYLSEKGKTHSENFNIENFYLLIINYLDDYDSLERINQLLAFFILSLENNTNFHQLCFFYCGKYYGSFLNLTKDKIINSYNITEEDLNRTAVKHTFNKNEHMDLLIIKNINSSGYRMLCFAKFDVDYSVEIVLPSLNLENAIFQTILIFINKMYKELEFSIMLEYYRGFYNLHREITIKHEL